MKPEDQRLLLRSFDEVLIPAEQERLGRLLDASPEARAELESLQRLRETVHGVRYDSFGPHFADRVMQRVTRPDTVRSDVLGRVRALLLPTGVFRWSVAVAVVAVFVALLVWIQPVNIEVPNTETRVVFLPDGSAVTLNSGAHMRYSRFRGRAPRTVELTGEGYFDVVPGKRLFVVETFNAEVLVPGTRFNVRAWPADAAAETRVELEVGTVDVRSHSGAGQVRLEPGQSTRVVGDSAPMVPASLESSSVARWRTGEMVFTSDPLADVLRELQRRYDMRFVLKSPELGTRRVTYLNPSPGSAENVLADICFSLQLQYRSIANGYEVLQTQEPQPRGVTEI
jgi:ferric-dicitrate binding protein FerR (iron transport regulator)